MNFKTARLRSAAVSALIFANLGILNAQDNSIHQLPAGTRLRLKMDVELSSKVATANDTFTAVVATPVVIRDVVVVPVGTVITGRVRRAASASHGGNGELDVVFESLRIPMLPVRTIDAELVHGLEARTSPFVNVLSVIGGTVIGAVFGGAVKGGSGAAIGAGAGAAAGTGVALFRKGKNVRIREDEEFEIVLKKDVILPVLDY